jgi:hypothetical protein
MGQSLFDKIQAKLELFRLEKRYTRSRHRRSAFVSNAVYVDGEYVYQTPNSTGSSDSSNGVDALHGEKASSHAAPRSSTMPVLPDVAEDLASPTYPDETKRKKLNRYSSMPGFGGSHEKSRVEVVQRRLSMIR